MYALNARTERCKPGDLPCFDTKFSRTDEKLATAFYKAVFFPYADMV